MTTDLTNQQIKEVLDKMRKDDPKAYLALLSDINETMAELIQELA